MSAFLVPELWCDGCSLRFGTGADGSGDAESIPAARAEAKEDGWGYRRSRGGYLDLCCNCDRKWVNATRRAPEGDAGEVER